MLMTWWRNRRRKRLAAEPFPADWLAIVRQNCRHFAGLNPEEQTRLLRDTRWFLAEKSIEATLGLVVTTEMRVTVAAHASLLGLGFDEPPFDRLRSIILQPDVYEGTRTHRIQPGLDLHSQEQRLGEAWRNGPVLLSWKDVARQCRDAPDGRNVVLHEFAHLLDMDNDDADGIPVFENDEALAQWREVTGDEFRRLVRHAAQGRLTVLDWYGATNQAEFFAVATESFFEQPLDLQAGHPRLYEVLASFYKQDPAGRALARMIVPRAPVHNPDAQ